MVERQDIPSWKGMRYLATIRARQAAKGIDPSSRFRIDMALPAGGLRAQKNSVFGLAGISTYISKRYLETQRSLPQVAHTSHV